MIQMSHELTIHFKTLKEYNLIPISFPRFFLLKRIFYFCHVVLKLIYCLLNKMLRIKKMRKKTISFELSFFRCLLSCPPSPSINLSIELTKRNCELVRQTESNITKVTMSFFCRQKGPGVHGFGEYTCDKRDVQLLFSRCLLNYPPMISDQQFLRVCKENPLPYCNVFLLTEPDSVNYTEVNW